MENCPLKKTKELPRQRLRSVQRQEKAKGENSNVISVPDKLEEKRLICCNSSYVATGFNWVDSFSSQVSLTLEMWHLRKFLSRKLKIQFIREGANVPPLAKDPYNANNFNIKAR